MPLERVALFLEKSMSLCYNVAQGVKGLSRPGTMDVGSAPKLLVILGGLGAEVPTLVELTV